jgi:hypothetical protein
MGSRGAIRDFHFINLPAFSFENFKSPVKNFTGNVILAAEAGKYPHIFYLLL